MSYFPVMEPLARRRRRLRRTYGFLCRCARCELEAGWAAEDGEPTGEEPDDEHPADEDDGDDSMDLGTAEGASGGEGEAAEAAEERELDEEEEARRVDRMDPVYSMWFMKNLCPKENCGGTLAAPNPTADHMLCNYCGAPRTDAEFFAALEGLGE